MKSSITLLVFLISFSCFSQNCSSADSADMECYKARATDYLDKKLGKDFRKKYLVYDTILKYNCNYPFPPIHLVIAFSIRRPNKQEDILLPVYFDGEEIDSLNTIIDKDSIVNGRELTTCGFFIGRKTAMQIAKLAISNLEENKTQLNFSYLPGNKKWSNWGVSISDSENSGRTVLINTKTAVYEISKWLIEN